MYSAYADPYGGWDRLAARLKSDGIQDSLIRSVYNGTVVPPYSFVPFHLKPKETEGMYAGFQTPQIIELGHLCRDGNTEILKRAQRVFGVEPSIIVAIILVESKCGRRTGRELIVNRLSRVANIGEENNLKNNLDELLKEDPSVTYEQVKNRSEYLEQTFYPQLKALFQEHQKGYLDIFSLKGSVAGAFGWPQFLPLTYSHYGTDGDKDGHISLFNPADAIFSVAHFLAAHGWKKSLNHKEKRDIIWSYNKSEPYIDTVLQLSDKLS